MNKEIYKQIAEEQPYCQMCGSNQMLAIHHVFGGRNRTNSTKYNMLIRVCDKCHRKIHKTNPISLKQEYQRKFGNDEEFIKVFGRSYL